MVTRDVFRALQNIFDGAFMQQIAKGSSIKYAKFSEKLTFLTPWYAHVRVRIRELEMSVFRKILCTSLMDGP